MRSKVCVLYILIVILLVGCDQVQNKQYFLTHPKSLKKVLNQCINMPNQGLNNANCKQASLAYSEFETLLTRSQQNGQAFGQEIIQGQLKIAALKTQIAKLKENKKTDAKIIKPLYQELDKLEQQNQVYMAVIRIQGV